MQNVEAPVLSQEELKLLEDYRSGRLLASSADKVIDASDLQVLNGVDNQVKTFLYEIGLLEERKSYFLEQLASARNLKNNALQEVMLKYGIPANQPFKINRDTGIVEFDIQDSDLV